MYREILGRVAHQRQKCSEAMKKTIDQSKLEIPQFVKERLIVDETRKMIYCPIPKAGSSNWKRIFIKLTHPGQGSKYQNKTPDRKIKFHEKYTLYYTRAWHEYTRSFVNINGPRMKYGRFETKLRSVEP